MKFGQNWKLFFFKAQFLPACRAKSPIYLSFARISVNVEVLEVQG